MKYEDLVVLIPSHSLEDFPQEQPEPHGTGLLNAWQILYHPRLIASARTLPRWHRADGPPELCANRLFVIPSCCRDRVPASWVDSARREGAVIVADRTERADLLRAALEPLGEGPALNPDLVADFLAFGFCTLQIELLTRHMRHFSNLDEVRLQRELFAAADAVLALDDETARDRLRGAFETLTEARERFYPVESFLLDLCLVLPRLVDDAFLQDLHGHRPFNVMITGEDLDELARTRPEAVRSLREAIQRRLVTLVGGLHHEGPLALLPLESVLWQLQAGARSYERALGTRPAVWASRRYALNPHWPALLARGGFLAAFHLAMDDGFYPDQEYAKVRWDDPTGSAIDAISRIPLGAESANSYLRLPARLAESMDHDQIAVAVFARWPTVKVPWFDDLRRIHQYAPVLGRLATLEDLFTNTDSPHRLAQFDLHEYLAPYLSQSVARGEENPISRYPDHVLRRQQYDDAEWLLRIARALRNQPLQDDELEQVESAIETAIEPKPAGSSSPADLPGPAPGEMLARLRARACAEFAAVVAPPRGNRRADSSAGGDPQGFLLVNPRSFARRATLRLPRPAGAAHADGHVSAAALPAVAFSQAVGEEMAVTVDLPPCGFVWLPASVTEATAPPPRRSSETDLADEFLLRNDFFEVHVNPQTGGLGQIKGYGRAPNRLSFQLAMRFPKEKRIPPKAPGEAEVVTAYSQMRLNSIEIVSTGPALGEIRVRGDLLDPADGSVLCGYDAAYRVYRGRPVVDVDVELSPRVMPEEGPWSNYYAARFAWHDESAALTRTVLHGAHPVQTRRDERFETRHYLEIAAESQRTTIVTRGLPFFRKTGPRMADLLLLCAGEQRRRFSFQVVADHAYPCEAALDALSPPMVIPTEGAAPAAGRSGWLLHVDVRNVQLTRILPLVPAPPDAADAWDPHPPASAVPSRGFAVRLVETEGRGIRCHLRCFRTPSSARQRDFGGKTVSPLVVRDDAVQVDLTAYEVADVELWFEGT